MAHGGVPYPALVAVEMMRALAKQSVQRFAGMEPGRPVGGTYYLYRTLRNLDLEGMLEKLMEVTKQQVGGELLWLAVGALHPDPARHGGASASAALRVVPHALLGRPAVVRPRRSASRDHVEVVAMVRLPSVG